MKTTQYLIIRHGSNAANQSMRESAPVAIVTAASQDEATRIALDFNNVSVWPNQRLAAVPVSRARREDLREQEAEQRDSSP